MAGRQISYVFDDVKEAMEKYCFENFLTLKEFLEKWGISDQAYRYFESMGSIPVTAMKKLRVAYPKLNLRRIRMAHGLTEKR